MDLNEKTMANMGKNARPQGRENRSRSTRYSNTFSCGSSVELNTQNNYSSNKYDNLRFYNSKCN
jgi:hypothetical protein